MTGWLLCATVLMLATPATPSVLPMMRVSVWLQRAQRSVELAVSPVSSVCRLASECSTYVGRGHRFFRGIFNCAVVGVRSGVARLLALPADLASVGSPLGSIAGRGLGWTE